jgi:hypothetical protein
MRTIKMEYLNSESMSEEYFEDLPYETEMDIKHEKETNNGNTVKENELTPASRLEKLNVKMEAQLITEEIIGEVQMCNQPQPKKNLMIFIKMKSKEKSNSLVKKS